MNLFECHRIYKKKKFLSFINDKEKRFKFLIIRNGLIGDIVFITPLLKRIGKTFINSEIEVLVSYNSREVLINFPSVTKIHTIKPDINLIKQVFFYLKFKKKKYDILLNQEVNTHYSIMSTLVGAKFKIGFRNKLDFLLDIVYPREGHVVPAELRSVKDWTANF